MDVKEGIQKAVEGAVASLGVSDVVVVLDHPAELAHGDYSSNISLAAAKKLGENPKVLAQKIVDAIGSIDGVEKIEVAGAGFINFYLSRDSFASGVENIVKSGAEWGKSDALKGKRVMFEFTDPNPFKVFHIGHLMSNAIGESLSRTNEWCGASVVRANYQGDIGPHVAKAIWAMNEAKNEMPEEGASLSEKTTFLGQMYVKGDTAYNDSEETKGVIDAINKKLYERSDENLNSLYDTGRRWSLAHFEEIYAILGTKFDYYFFESETGPVGLEVVQSGLKSGVFEESEGAVVYKGEKNGLHTRVFITKAGTPTYETKELGLDKTKFEKEKLDHSVIVTANEQDGFFKVVLSAMAEVLPHVAENTQHISHGMMQLTGGKMSSRKGNVITGESLLEDMRVEALEKMAERELGDEKPAIADAVAVSAIKYSILKQTAGKNIIFDPEKSLSFEGDSGPYLQYSYVRALSILRKADEEGVAPSTAKMPEEISGLEKTLYRFPEVVERAQKEYEPHYITTFLTEIASAFNSWYATGKIVDPADPTSPYKVALTQAFAHTMKNGLWLLGIQAPEKM